MEIEQYRLKSNGSFSIIKDVYDKVQHPNQQNGLNKYIDVLDHSTGNVNSVKLYDNGMSGELHFMKKGRSYYLKDFTLVSVYVPFQIYLT